MTNLTETKTDESTLFMLEVRNGITWFIDYSESDGVYSVHKSEQFRCVRKTFGEALSFIFEKLGTSTFKAVYPEK